MSLKIGIPIKYLLMSKETNTIRNFYHLLNFRK